MYAIMSKFLLKDNSTYYLLFGIHKKIPLFYSEKICEFLIKEIFFYQKKYKFELYTFSIMPCHLNLMAKFNKKEDIENFERDYKSITANYILNLLKKDKINDYKFICGIECECDKYHIKENDNCGALHPQLSNSIKSTSNITLNYFKYKRRIWRHRSWKYIIDNEEIFKEKLNYIYYNHQKHKYNKINNYISTEYKIMLKYIY